MNVTLSIDAQLVEQARIAAQKQGTSLNALIRQYLQNLVDGSSVKLATELIAEMRKNPGHSKGARIRRSDAYSGRA